VRNEIYQHLAQPRSIDFGTLSLNLHMQHCLPGLPLCWTSSGRNTLGLSQAGRKLRREFLPLLEQQSTVVIGMHLVDPYIADFFPGVTEARGNLRIMARQYGVSLELAGLLRLYARSPSLRVFLHTPFPCPPRRVIPEDRNSAWLVYAIKFVSRMTYTRYVDTLDRANHHFHVYLTHEAFTAIASEGETEIPGQHWANLVGFPGMKRRKVVVTVTEAPSG